MIVKDLIKKADKEKLYEYWWNDRFSSEDGKKQAAAEYRNLIKESPDMILEKSVSAALHSSIDKKAEDYKKILRIPFIKGIEDLYKIRPRKEKGNKLILGACDNYDFDDNNKMIKGLDVFLYDAESLKEWNENKAKLCKTYTEIKSIDPLPKFYGLFLIERPVMLGYEISDKIIEKYSVEAIVNEILSELFFFGFESKAGDKRICEEFEEIDRRAKEVENGAKTYSMEEVEADLKKKYPKFEWPKETKEEHARLMRQTRKISIKNINALISFFKTEKDKG